MSAENCSNGIDDDKDGWVDCYDEDCQAQGACCALGTAWDGSACVAIPENCGNNKDDDGDGLVDCADADCNVEPNTAEKGCDITNDTIVYDKGEIGYYCADDGVQGMCCPEGTELDVDGTGNTYCKATQELCFNNVDEFGDGIVDCADPQCNQRTNDFENPKPCTGSSKEARYYTLLSFRGDVVTNETYYCSYGWTEEEDTGHCCPQQQYWDASLNSCVQDTECSVLWDSTFPENSIRYNASLYIAPYTQACCPVIRFGEAQYKGWQNVKIY